MHRHQYLALLHIDELLARLCQRLGLKGAEPAPLPEIQPLTNRWVREVVQIDREIAEEVRSMVEESRNMRSGSSWEENIF